MIEPFVRLCPEVTRENALVINRWMRDEEVGKYLSDDRSAAESISQAVERSGLPVVTHLFNRGGRFFLACDKSGAPVGFVRLAEGRSQTEIVVVIGDQSNWGRRLGLQAIRESMKIAFFELRSPRIVAKIRKENTRSIRAFQRAGFTLDHETADMKVFSLTMDAYLSSIKARAALGKTIMITEIDRERLMKVIQYISFHQTGEDQVIRGLEREVNRAEIVRPEQVPPDIITMNTKTLLSVDGEEIEMSLVYPDKADWAKNRLSELSPVGTAIIGYRQGDAIAWEIPSGTANIHIKKVLYQPEAAGDYHL